ncbi:MAG: prepilin-type N-terminal cleavage/methylation domain-containing protein [Verrucomicrobia bacterium]|nr:MAG: prepilin-type N-terminal cleavage/methylation domain-containing protein [Verrucomicrobiota bacterium]
MNPRLPSRRDTAFTLLEVAVASAVLAIALFAILSLCSISIRAARALGRVHVDASSLASMLSLTNRLEEGVDSGDFGQMHPGYSWRRNITEYNTNGLYLVEFEVLGVSNGHEDRSRLNLLLYRPDSVRRAVR